MFLHPWDLDSCAEEQHERPITRLSRVYSKNCTYPEGNIYFLLWHVGAGQMHACFDSDKLLACFDEFGGEVGCSSTSIPAKTVNVLQKETN
jgi:hypothetical protein